MNRSAKPQRRGEPPARPRRAAAEEGDDKPLLFISWSGEESRRVARELKELLGLTLPTTTPWMSDDIGAGQDWNDALVEALGRAKFGVICLTKSNFNAPWLHYEAGFLAGAEDKHVFPYLLDFKRADLKGPLSRLQAVEAERDATRALITTINKVQKGGFSEDKIDKLFNMLWGSVEEPLAQMRAAAAAGEIVAQSGAGAGLATGAELMLVRGMRRKEEEEVAQEPAGPASEPSGPGPAAQPQPAEVSARRAPGAFALEITNPSNYSRKGYVAAEWEQIYRLAKIPPNNLCVYDNAGNRLLSQVDLYDPEDPSRGGLVFSLKSSVPGRGAETGGPYLVYLERGAEPFEAASAPRIEVQWGEEGEAEGGQPQWVKLINARLEVTLQLAPAPWNDGRNWYAGAASSAVFEGKEILNAYVDPLDYEKRCMQIADLWLLAPVKRMIRGEQTIIRQPYQLVSQSSGPVRASIKIASAVLDCGYVDPATKKRVASKCQIVREISLYEGAHYLTERLYVQDAPTERSGKAGALHPFEARYFAYVNFGVDRNRHHYKSEWLVINSDWAPSPGYGFASDRPLRSFENPHPGYRQEEHRHKTFSWVLGSQPQGGGRQARGHKAECLHLFMRGLFNDLQARVNRAWYEVIEEPLQVKAAQPAPPGAA